MITEFDLKVEKMRKYCLYRDRCHSEVRSKLIQEKIYGDELEEIIACLIQENFLNEERFARSYVKGKFTQNKWGKVKIEMELKRLKVSPYCIKKGFEEINEELYRNTIDQLWEKKMKTTKGDSPFAKNKKVAQYLMNKGYGYEELSHLMKY